MVRDEGFDDFLDALDRGAGYFLACENDHGSLPPRRVCPHCGGDLEKRDLPETGEIVSFTVIHVATPSFVDRTPYATAVVDFGPVTLTGIVHGVDTDDVETGMVVSVGVEGEGESRSVVFEPR